MELVWSENEMKVNDHLLEILARDIVKHLPESQRNLYTFIVNLEDELAQQANTSDHFMSLLVKHSPHQQAAQHFSMPFGEVMKEMKLIEGIINRELDEKVNKIKWIDYTNKIKEQRREDSFSRSYFLFIS